MLVTLYRFQYGVARWGMPSIEYSSFSFTLGSLLCAWSVSYYNTWRCSHKLCDELPCCLWRDLWIWVRSHSRSLEMVRLGEGKLVFCTNFVSILYGLCNNRVSVWNRHFPASFHINVPKKEDSPNWPKTSVPYENGSAFCAPFADTRRREDTTGSDCLIQCNSPTRMYQNWQEQTDRQTSACCSTFCLMHKASHGTNHYTNYRQINLLRVTAENRLQYDFNIRVYQPVLAIGLSHYMQFIFHLRQERSWLGGPRIRTPRPWQE